MSQERPGNTQIFELADGDLTGERAVGFVEDVLRCDFHTVVEMFAGEEEVQAGGSDHDFGVGV